MPGVAHKIRKIQKAYYFSPDVVDLIEQEANRTGYHRNTVLEILVREKLGRPSVEEASVVLPSTDKPRRRSSKIDIFS